MGGPAAPPIPPDARDHLRRGESASGAGRIESDVAKLAALSERFAIPVVQRKNRYMCLANDHPMNIGFDADAHLDSADVIVVLECDVPWIPKKKTPKPDCKIIHIGADPIFASYPLRGFTCDLAIVGVIGATLPALTEALASCEKSAASRIDARRKRVALQHEKIRTRLAERLEQQRNASPIHPAWINHCINNVKGTDAIVLKEALTPSEHLSFSKPGTYYSLGQGGALGWSLGTALGAKAGAPDKLVICAVGDGSYMFGNPLAAHYVGKAEKLPTLTIVYNNEMWNAVRRNTRDVYPDGYAARANQGVVRVLPVDAGRVDVFVVGQRHRQRVPQRQFFVGDYADARRKNERTNRRNARYRLFGFGLLLAPND